jgi:hypothetical protein
MAFFLCGRFSVTVTTPSRRVTSIVSTARSSMLGPGRDAPDAAAPVP